MKTLVSCVNTLLSVCWCVHLGELKNREAVVRCSTRLVAMVTGQFHRQ